MPVIVKSRELIANVAQAIVKNTTDTGFVFALTVVNRNFASARISVALSTSQSSPAASEWIEFNTELPGKGSLERTGIIISSGQYIVVRSDTANVCASAWGLGDGATNSTDDIVTQVNPFPLVASGTTANLYAVDASATEVAAVGDSGVLTRATTGTWTASTPLGTTTSYYNITANGSTWVAAGAGGRIANTTTGPGGTWTSTLTNANYFFRGGVYSSTLGRYFVGGLDTATGNGMTYYSTDSISWTQSSTAGVFDSGNGGGEIRTMTATATQFQILAFGINSSQRLLFSFNGNSGNWLSSVGANSTFVTGSTWNGTDRVWICTGDGRVRSSTSAGNYTSYSSTNVLVTGGTALNDIAYTASLPAAPLLTVGDNGLAYYSTNGTTWTQITTNTFNRLNSCAYSASLGRWVIVGDGGAIHTWAGP